MAGMSKKCDREGLEIWLDITKSLQLLPKECGFLSCGHWGLLEAF